MKLKRRWCLHSKKGSTYFSLFPLLRSTSAAPLPVSVPEQPSLQILTSPDLFRPHWTSLDLETFRRQVSGGAS